MEARKKTKKILPQPTKVGKGRPMKGAPSLEHLHRSAYFCPRRLDGSSLIVLAARSLLPAPTCMLFAHRSTDPMYVGRELQTPDFDDANANARTPSTDTFFLVSGHISTWHEDTFCSAHMGSLHARRITLFDSLSGAKTLTHSS